MAASPNGSALSPLHRAWRLLPARERRRLLSRTTAWLAPRPDAAPPAARLGLAVGGELSRPSGLGEVARLMLRGLDRLGLQTWPIDVGTAVSRGAASAAAIPPSGVPLLLHVNAPFLPLACLRLPRPALRGRRVIGYWAWELPVAPPDWWAGVPFVHEAWVLSRFTAEAIETLLPGRVRVVTPPVALDSAEPPSCLGRAGFGLPEAAVIVLASFSLASSFERKNPLQTIAAFRAAFGDRTDRVLVLKVANGGNFPADLDRLRVAIGGAGNIQLETRLFPAPDSRALTRAADIVLSLHRSEGFGLLAAEAMLCGKPVIATGWSGNMDFMDPENSALVGYRLVPAHDPRGVFEARGALWAEPDQAEAVTQLRRLADDPALRARMGLRARADAEARLGVDSLAAAVRSLGLPVP